MIKITLLDLLELEQEQADAEKKQSESTRASNKLQEVFGSLVSAQPGWLAMLLLAQLPGLSRISRGIRPG